MYVDGSNGRATATIYWDNPAFAHNTESVRLVVTVQRSGVSQPNTDCGWFTVSVGTHGAHSCSAYLPNPAGDQAWRSDAEVYVGLSGQTPTIVRSDPLVVA